MKHLRSLLHRLSLGVAILSLCILPCACVDEEQYDNSPQGNFEALWRIIDEHYCFLDYKKAELRVDWQQIYEKYRVRVNSDLTRLQLFEVLTDMLGELRDGHVNLSATHDFGRNWSWYESYPTNFSDSLLRRYLGTDYKIAGGAKYRILDDNIGYIYYGSFSQAIGDGNLDEIFSHMLLCRGLIIDVRGNGGGELTTAEQLAARFCNEQTLVGYIQHKTGPGHNDFSSLEPHYIDPSSGIRWQKPVCVLTNRHVFSAANDFVMSMKAMPAVTIVGDHTGGGAGMPFSASLPNGWVVRFSAVPTFDSQKQPVEHGIDPDHFVSLTDADFLRGEDTIIEFARKLLAK